MSIHHDRLSPLFSCPLLPILYSSFPHPCSALFLSGAFIEQGDEKILILTDSRKTLEDIRNLGPIIWKKPIRILENIGELFRIEEYRESVLVLHSRIFAVDGNREGIRRTETCLVTRGETTPQNQLIESFLRLGYRQSDVRGEPGTYTREGSIIRICLDTSEYLIEYFDDEIESIVEHSGGANHIQKKSCTLPRICQKYPDEIDSLSESDTTEKMNTELFSIIEPYPLILISCEFLRDKKYFGNSRILELSSLKTSESIDITLTTPKLETVGEFLDFLRASKCSPIVLSRHARKVREFLDINGFSQITVEEEHHRIESFSLASHTDLMSEYWKNQVQNGLFTIIGDDIIGKIFVQNRVRKSTIKNLDLLLQVKEGDLVVHREHGIGRFISLTKKRTGLIEREYMEIEYAEKSIVYVPLTELRRITKYVGDSHEELTKLAGKEWEKSLSKTDEEIEKIAEEILATDAKRKLTTRIPFGSFPEEEKKFREAFPHIHTTDQSGVITEIFRDMEGEHPMDRLVSGDVGFGKTEVAMNAIYKAVLSGMQVAVVSPLLILAEEHRETFDERLGQFGVRVASLTRMTKAKNIKNILEGIRSGNIDVVVGTHRLFSEDVRFRRLGLLIIDEEHRFGVIHKEAIKKMKAHVDILSLSATPIPRSLNLALSGLKKISLLSTPPKTKKPIETIIARWDGEMIRTAIETELTRGGQVIILHNRIRALPMIEREMNELLENSRKNGTSPVRITITHGQMLADEIEDRIISFKKGEYDILLTTTIIENGVNFLGANTIIVSDAEEFGLAQLHQIRGRVGRKDIAGCCYLMYRKYELSSEERERLMILAEHSGLGSGYEIAMRDMQMRGTGDILGVRQSGRSKEVGISLYFQLLEEKIDFLRQGKQNKNLTKIDLELSYVIPDEYFDSEADKLSFFRDIESIETLEDLDQAKETFETENMPENMSNLFLMMQASIILAQYGVIRLSKAGTNYHFDFEQNTTPIRLRSFLERFDPNHDMVIVTVTKIRIDGTKWKNARNFLQFLGEKQSEKL